MTARAANILKWWPLLLAFGAGATWAADQYVDGRIDSKLGAVVDRLFAIEKTLVGVDERLKNVEQALRK